MRQKEFSASPTHVLFPNQIGDRDPDIFEPNFIHFMAAINGNDGANGNPRSRHVDQQERNAFLWLAVSLGAHQEKAPIGMLG